MYIADMLSRAYLKSPNTKDEAVPRFHIFQLQSEESLAEEIENVRQFDHMRLSPGTHSQVQYATASDPVLQTLASTILLGWSDLKTDASVSVH